MERYKILYVQSSGLNTPERLYAPFILAQTARAMDVEADIFFLIRGIEVLKKGEAEKIKLGDFPTLKEVMEETVAKGVKLYVCEQSAQLLGIPRGGFIEEATVAGAATLNDLILEADKVISL